MMLVSFPDPPSTLFGIGSGNETTMMWAEPWIAIWMRVHKHGNLVSPTYYVQTMCILKLCSDLESFSLLTDIYVHRLAVVTYVYVVGVYIGAGRWNI